MPEMTGKIVILSALTLFDGYAGIVKSDRKFSTASSELFTFLIVKIEPEMNIMSKTGFYFQM